MPADPDDTNNKYKQTEAQLEAIETEIRESQALTSPKCPTSALRSLYDKDSNFDKGVLYLAKHYRDVRRVRGDGNCYYRALLYGMCETLLIRPEECQRILQKIQTSLDELVKQGYERFTLEAFWEEFVELLENLDEKTLHSLLNQENGVSDCCTFYMRMLTSSHLKKDPQRFVHFLEGDYVDIPTFCAREVEPMGKECSMVQVLALAEALEIFVSVEYLDGRDFTDALQQHSFGPEDSKTKVTLLYRPGHYDILYK